MTHKTGQGYKTPCHALLHVEWPANVHDRLRRARLRTATGPGRGNFGLGYGRGDWEFFYDAMKSAVSSAGLWDWFLEAGDGRCGECGRGQ